MCGWRRSPLQRPPFPQAGKNSEKISCPLPSLKLCAPRRELLALLFLSPLSSPLLPPTPPRGAKGTIKTWGSAHEKEGVLNLAQNKKRALGSLEGRLLWQVTPKSHSLLHWARPRLNTGQAPRHPCRLGMPTSEWSLHSQFCCAAEPFSCGLQRETEGLNELFALNLQICFLFSSDTHKLLGSSDLQRNKHLLGMGNTGKVPNWPWRWDLACPLQAGPWLCDKNRTA